MPDWPGLLEWLEGSALGTGVRAAGVWAYAILNLAHILGVATLFGAILVLDLRLLGWHRRVNLASLAAVTVPVAAGGFLLAVLSGATLLATNASDYADNPFLLVKFAAIGLGLVNVLLLSCLSAWRLRATHEPDARQRRQIAVLGAVSLASWITAIGAGRLIGYW